MTTTPTETLKTSWRKMVSPYEEPDLRRSIWQLVNTLIPYALLWAAMLWSVRVSYWLTLFLGVFAAGFMMRLFIIFHDCCHGSFFKSKQANETVGVILGVLTLTPYFHWRHDHAVHHATAGNLDRRGVGDVTTWTVEEYKAAPRIRRLGYRLLRNPLFLFTVGSTFMFAVIHRLPLGNPGKRETQNIWLTNLAMLGIIVVLGLIAGFKAVFLSALPVIVFASGAGVWLFYVQHNFVGAYWERKDKWSFLRAGLEGSSLLSVAGRPALVQRQHRLSPYPPPQPEDPQLSPAGMLYRQPRFSGGSPDDPREPEISPHTPPG